MKKFGKASLTAIVAAAASSSIISDAIAGGFALREQSAEYLGSAFAGNATPGKGLSSMFFNPATVTQHDGFNSESNYSLVLPHSKAKNAGPAPGVPSAYSNSGNVGQWALLPGSYYSYQVNERVYIGMSVNAPFGLETRNDQFWGSPHGRKSDIFNITATPMFGIKMDRFAFGFGAQIDYIKGTLTSAAYTPIHGVYNNTKLEGDDWTAGFVAGLLIDVTDATQVGLGFRSALEHTLDGTFRTTGAPKVSAKAAVNLPASATLSLRHQLSDEFTLLGSVEWANWSTLKSLDIVTPFGTVSQSFDWKDSWFFSIGGEWQATDALTLRTGLAYEDSPVPDSTRSVRLPDNNRYWLSVGASYRFTDWLTVHGAYSHVFMDDGDVALPASATLPPLYASYKQHIDIVSVSGTINW